MPGKKWSKSFKAQRRYHERTTGPKGRATDGTKGPTQLLRVPRPPVGFRPIRAGTGAGVIRWITSKSYYSGFFATTAPAGVPTGVYAQILFTLSQATNASQLVALFDQYCISKVKVTFYPRWSVDDVEGTAAGNGNISSIFVVRDTDGAPTAYTSSASAMIHENVAVRRTNIPFSLSMSPKPAADYYKTAITTGYGAAGALDGLNWIDCVDSTVPHYGMDVWLDPPTKTGFITTYDCLVELKIGLREAQ